MPFHLILTLDYELFGNGSGCLSHCVVKPTENCLSILDKFDAKLCYFVDASEFRALKQYPEEFSSGMQDVENQLHDSVRKGHEIQLHLHPQWLGATFVDQAWDLDLSKWRIGDLSEQDLKQCIDEGLDYLKEFVKSASDQSTNHCCVFRAGGWAIQPESKVLKALSDAGIKMESTVAPGVYNQAKGDWYNFKQSPDLPFWNIFDDVCSVSDPAQARMVEVPIATASVGKVKHAKALKEAKQGDPFPQGCLGTYDGPNNKLQEYIGKFNKIANMGTVMLDFSTMPGWMLIEITNHFLTIYKDDARDIPIVAIGHNKNFTAKSAQNFEEWLNWVSQETDIEFSTYSGWYRTQSMAKVS